MSGETYERRVAELAALQAEADSAITLESETEALPDAMARNAEAMAAAAKRLEARWLKRDGFVPEGLARIMRGLEEALDAVARAAEEARWEGR